MKLWVAVGGIVAVAVGIVAVLLFDSELWTPAQPVGGQPAHRVVFHRPSKPSHPPPAPHRWRFALRHSVRRPPVHVAFAHPPRAGILFDVKTGRILWRLDPGRRLPIASLTKMLTALVVARRDRPDEPVPISRHAVHYQGSGVGVLPKGKRVPLRDLFDGLLLVSGNDAAIALAENDAGSVPAFVRRMNRWARRHGLRCSHFSTPSGIVDRGNYSCPRDLAALARADLADPRIARVVGERSARFRFPIKGGFLDLYNNDPFILDGTPGITGVKTGYTDAAGRCYVTTQRRRGHELGVVLLHSPNPLDQVPALLRAGARAEG